jgi:ribose 1,5-bisphosphokinase
MHQGELIYIIGPSGCGKDSIMEYAREKSPGDEVVFAHRYITRPANAGGENHVQLLPDEFQARLKLGLFALNWDSHGFRYGIGHEIDTWMEAGLNVAVNGSRAYLSKASKQYPNLRPILITVDPNILQQRLIDRGREPAEEIKKRLNQADIYEVQHPRLERINNSGELSQAGEQLLSFVRQKHKQAKKVFALRNKTAAR